MKRKSSTKKTTEDPNTIRDVVDIINDVPVDWRGFKIPKKSTNQNPNLTKNQRIEPDSRTNIGENCLENGEWNRPKHQTHPHPTERLKSVKQHSFEKKKHWKSHEKNERICNSDQLDSYLEEKESKQRSSSKGHRDDFEISKQDKIEIRRKVFEEQYWKTQVQRRYGVDQSPYHYLLTHQEHSADPRLQKCASPALPTPIPVQLSPSPEHAYDYQERGGTDHTTGKARRELFAIDTAKQRREREYEERLQREFERSKEEKKDGPNKAPRVWFYGTTY